MAMYGASVEYALHTLLNLVHAPERAATSARDLADFQKLPLAFMRKLLTKLEHAGIVVGAEGVRGGWTLARDAAQISVADVVVALQPGDRLFDCREIRARCALWPDAAPPSAATDGTCSINAVMIAAEAAMMSELRNHSIADLARRVERKTTAAGSRAVEEWFAVRVAGRRGETTKGDSDE